MHILPKFGYNTMLSQYISEERTYGKSAALDMEMQDYETGYLYNHFRIKRIFVIYN